MREVALPEGAVVTVRLLDTSLADASSVELGRDVIENADRLPVRFRIEYDRERVSDGNEYSLSAEVRRGDDLLYINDTVHTVLTRGAPGNRDVVVISTDPFDRCVEPLPGVIHSSFQREDLPREAVLHIRLIDVTDPEARLVLTETRKADLKGFPIEFELPSEGVKISRHHQYELEAEIVIGDEVLYESPKRSGAASGSPTAPTQTSCSSTTCSRSEKAGGSDQNGYQAEQRQGANRVLQRSGTTPATRRTRRCGGTRR